MKWNRAGRPTKNPAKPKAADKPYTKQELTVYADPCKALAAAVIRQWKEDGSPKSDLEGVKPWIEIVRDYD